MYLKIISFIIGFISMPFSVGGGDVLDIYDHETGETKQILELEGFGNDMYMDMDSGNIFEVIDNNTW